MFSWMPVIDLLFLYLPCDPSEINSGVKTSSSISHRNWLAAEERLMLFFRMGVQCKKDNKLQLLVAFSYYDFYLLPSEQFLLRKYVL